MDWVEETDLGIGGVPVKGPGLHAVCEMLPSKTMDHHALACALRRNQQLGRAPESAALEGGDIANQQNPESRLVWCGRKACGGKDGEGPPNLCLTKVQSFAGLPNTQSNHLLR